MASKLAASLRPLQRLRRFELERNPLWWTPGVEQLCASDVEPYNIQSLLDLAGPSARRQLEQQSLGYPDSQGSHSLRAQLAGMYGPQIGPEHVTICAPQEGILLSMLSMLQPGDTVVAVTPAYQSLQEIARSIGCEVRPWEVQWEQRTDGVLIPRFDPESLQQLLHGASVLVLNFPHNPTGALPSATDWARIQELCQERQVRIFNDEMYKGLEGQPQLELPSAAEVPGGHVSLGGLSKWAAMPGLRIGWVVCQDLDLVQELNCLKDYVSICPPGPSELLAELAIQHKERVLHRSQLLCSDGRDAVREFCGRHSEWIEWVEPFGTSVCFPRLKTASAGSWCQQLAKDEQTRLMLIPSGLFEMGDAHVRFGYGRSNTRVLLQRLEEHIERHGPPV